jgi:hypothetical protein
MSYEVLRSWVFRLKVKGEANKPTVNMSVLNQYPEKLITIK